MCAVILFKDAERAPETASALALTADDLVRLGIADEIVSEPLGGAHRDPASVIAAVGGRIGAALDTLAAEDRALLAERRYERLRAIGQFTTGA
jgi:acetyl-CoA carboxylase carboxyl transferase subunit alpha